eukprot:CAMPEP_0184083024 /NCGR_PEP_ID=MMETSP0974-20121125/3499_1 /TAXON_ID=483370 /ORGANISM="non described non described, Strain CCMP2097" /LENGTH=191 /DNA_ID=CAMNT_0026385699 /DNA_START=547 /DNA_END=1119 /DNA_ORIENTATION=-
MAPIEYFFQVIMSTAASPMSWPPDMRRCAGRASSVARARAAAAMEEAKRTCKATASDASTPPTHARRGSEAGADLRASADAGFLQTADPSLRGFERKNSASCQKCGHRGGAAVGDGTFSRGRPAGPLDRGTGPSTPTLADAVTGRKKGRDARRRGAKAPRRLHGPFERPSVKGPFPQVQGPSTTPDPVELS